MCPWSRCGIWLLAAAGCLSSAAAARAQQQTDPNPLARGIFKQLIEINTTDSVGNVTTAADAMGARLHAAGFAAEDVIVAGPTDRKKNLVVRLHGSGKRKPILFNGHLDVVEARREDWTTDPFQFVEHDGFFYGRGAEDMKSGDAILVANFIRMKKEGFVPDRDLILALTADEEGGNFNGVDWLVKEHRDWIDAEYCINLDGGEFERQKDKRILTAIQASEKVYADFQLEALNSGGHSSVPSSDNAIYHLAGALLRIQSYAFPLEINEITRNYFESSAKLTSGALAQDLRDVARQPPNRAAVARLSAMPYYNALLRTTCVATLLSGGHAANALPQMARSTVNCRIFPGEDPEEVRRTLERVVADPKVSVAPVAIHAADGTLVRLTTVPPSPLLPELTQAMEKTVEAMWGKVPVVATMSTGASDGRITRTAGIPTYGISCMFYQMDDSRAHGKDERMSVQDFYEGLDFNYLLIKELASPH
jgi:acetylornithine deacetylase/succinyl-diaminopimelate desuccinylase-like protein